LLKFKTKHFGEIEINGESLLTFNQGLFGFEHLRKFFFIETEDNENFKWLQSGDNEKICFLVIDPVTFMFDYAIELPDETVDELQIKAAEDVYICALVVVPEDPKKISANLCGPIIVNAETRLGKQIVSQDPKHEVRHYILDEMNKNAEKMVVQEHDETDSDTEIDTNEKEVVNAGSNKKI